MNPFELNIERWAWPGLGLGFLEGKAVFLPNVLPGERVLVEVIKEGKRHVEGRLAQVLEAAPERIPSPCPQYPACGGCGLLHLEYGAQLKAKTGLLGELMTPLALPAPPEVVASPQIWGYRHKASLKSDSAKVGLNRYRSEQVVPLKGCKVLPEALLEAVNGVVPRPGWDLKALQSASSRQLALVWHKRGQTRPQAGYGQTVIEDYGAGELSLQADRFSQSNPFVTALILKDIQAALAGVDRLVEHYAGSGTLSRALVPQVKRLWAYEADSGAAKWGQRNLKDFEAVTFKAAKAEAGQIPASAQALLVDPPRSGLAPRLVEAAINSKLGKVVYLSCDAQTQARDLARLVEGGFRLEWVKGYDMYAHTGHLETLACLSR